MKQEIILTLMDLLRIRGLKFTMEDIARRLHMSKTTLYKHYKSRDALLMAMMEYILDRMTETEQAVLSSDKATLEEKLIATACMYTQDYGIFDNQVYEYIYQHPKINARLKAYNQVRFQHFNQLLDEGEQKGLVRKSINRDIFFQMLLLAHRGMLDPGLLCDLNTTYGPAIDSCLQILLHGILKDQ